MIDHTIGGDYHDEFGSWTGFKLRGQSEAYVIARINFRRLLEYYGPAMLSDGMGV